MSDTFPMWRRQVLPEGRLAIPQAGPSLAESFGAGMIETVGEMASASVETRHADSAAWTAGEISQAKYDLARRHAEAKEAAPAGAPNFAGATAAMIDAHLAQLDGAAPDHDARAAIRRRLEPFRADLVADAIRFEASARLAQRAANVERALKLAGETVALMPEQFAGLLDDVAEAVTSLDLPEERKTALVQAAQRDLAQRHLAASLEREPESAERLLDGGALDRLLDAEDRNQWRARIEARRRDDGKGAP